MNKLTSSFAATLLLASSSAWSETGSSTDLTYCLELKSNIEIAKCSGEVSSGNRKKAYTRDQVEQRLSHEEMTAPASKSKPPARPAATGENAGMESTPDLSREKTIAPSSDGEAPVQPAATGEKTEPAISDEEAVRRSTAGENAGKSATPEF